MAFDVMKYIELWPRIEAAFAKQGITLNVMQAMAIASDLWQLFTPAAPVSPPQPAPTPQPAPPAPPEDTPYTADQIAAFYMKYLGRAPENTAVVNEWMHDKNAESNIKNTPE